MENAMGVSPQSSEQRGWAVSCGSSAGWWGLDQGVVSTGVETLGPQQGEMVRV